MPMFPFCFWQLQQCLTRFGSLSNHWPAVLAHRIVQCNGFLEQLTLSEECTTNWLCDKTISLFETLPDDSNDAAVIQLLATEFEGFHCHAVVYDGSLGSVVDNTSLSIENTWVEYWNSLHEPFSTFIDRHPEADLFIGEQAHTSSADAASWFAAALGMHTCH